MIFVCPAVRESCGAWVGWQPSDPSIRANRLVANPDDGGAMWYALEGSASRAPRITRTALSGEINFSADISGVFSDIQFSDILGESAKTQIVFGNATVQAGRYLVPDNGAVLVKTRIACIQTASIAEIVVGSACSFSGESTASQLERVSAILAPTAEMSTIKNFSIQHSEALITNYAILIDCNEDSRPYKCTVSNITADLCVSAVHVKAALECEISDTTYKGNRRGVVVYSAERCKFKKNKTAPSNGVPIVGFLNISTITKSFGRGFIENEYEDTEINGWSEEGFSFDLRGNEADERAHRLMTHVAAVDTQGITTVSGCSLLGPQYSVTFHTGALAGQSFRIGGHPADNRFDLSGFSHESCSPGDYLSVSLTCTGNIVRGPVLNGSGDLSGIIFYVFGAGTRVESPSLNNCRIEIMSTAFNKPYPGIATCFYAPHGISVNNPVFSRPSIDGVVVDREDWNYEDSASDDSILKNDVLTLDLEILGSNSTKNAYQAVGRMLCDSFSSGDEFTSCIETWENTLNAASNLSELSPAQLQAITIST